MKKLVLQKILLKQAEFSIESGFLSAKWCGTEFRMLFLFHGPEFQVVFFSGNDLEQNSKCLLSFLFHWREFRVGFSSAEWFRKEFREFASIFVPWYWIPSIFLPCRMVRNGIPQNSRNFYQTNQLFVLSIPSIKGVTHSTADRQKNIQKSEWLDVTE